MENKSAGIWVKASERLPKQSAGVPELINNKSKPILIKTGKRYKIGYYFPNRFKTVEWEDWDDYKQEDFPYTEEDTEKGCVWLREGFYELIDCERCDGYWQPIADVKYWQWLDESQQLQSQQQENFHQTVCKEHRWGTVQYSDTSGNKNERVICLNCGAYPSQQVEQQEDKISDEEINSIFYELENELFRLYSLEGLANAGSKSYSTVVLLKMSVKACLQKGSEDKIVLQQEFENAVAECADLNIKLTKSVIWEEKFYNHLKHIYDSYADEWTAHQMSETSEFLHDYQTKDIPRNPLLSL